MIIVQTGGCKKKSLLLSRKLGQLINQQDCELYQVQDAQKSWHAGISEHLYDFPTDSLHTPSRCDMCVCMECVLYSPCELKIQDWTRLERKPIRIYVAAAFLTLLPNRKHATGVLWQGSLLACIMHSWCHCLGDCATRYCLLSHFPCNRQM